MMSPDLAPSASTSIARRPRTRHLAVVACTTVAVVGTLLVQTPGGAQERDAPRPSALAKASSQWEDYGGGPDSSKFVDLSQITPKNVAGLKVAWTYPVGDNNVYQFNPIVVGSTMYVLAKNQSLVALDATTGKELWIHAGPARHRPARHQLLGEPGRQGPPAALPDQQRPAGDRRAHRQVDPDALATNGIVDLRRGHRPRSGASSAGSSRTRPARSSRTCCCSARRPAKATSRRPATLRAYDVRTGKLVWAFHTVPHPGEDGYETWPKDAWKYVGGANTWGEISVDARRGIAYFPTGSPTYDYYGADRIGSNLYANSLLALDARTGKRLWHYQVVHHDLWDYDLTAAPQLVTVKHERQDDRRRRAGGQARLPFRLRPRHRQAAVADRGAPDRRRATMPGEQTWPTQPFPTKPAPFARQQMTVDDLTPFFLTDAERAEWVERAEEGEERPVRAAFDRARDGRRPRRGRGRQLGQHRRVPGQGAGLRHQQRLSVVLQIVGVPGEPDAGRDRARSSAPISVAACCTRRPARPATAPSAWHADGADARSAWARA